MTTTKEPEPDIPNSSGSPSASPAIPATGCSSPGPSSPGPPPSSATTSAPSRTSRPRSGRPPARCRASPASRSASAPPTSTRPGDEPDVLVAMNPAALKTNIGDLPAGGALIVNSDAFTAAEPEQGGLRLQPADRRVAQARTRVFEIPISTLNERSLDGLDMTSKQKDLTKNFFALGIMFWLYERSMEPDDRLDRPEVLRPPGRRRGEQAGAQGRLRVRRDHRDLPHALPGQAGEAAARDVPEHHRQRGDGPRLPGRVEARRPAAVLRQLPDHPGQRHPPPALGATSRSASRPSRPRTRSPRSARPSGRATAARSG